MLSFPMLPLDHHDVWTTINLLVDTATCGFIALRLAPPRAARLVEEQAGGVYERQLQPRLAAQLDEKLGETQEALREEMREVVAEHGADLLKRFDDVRAQARAEAEAHIAAARAQLEEQARALEASAQARAEGIIKEAQSEAARFLAGRSAEARATRQVAEAQAETAITTWILQALGGNDYLAGKVVGWLRSNAPGAWKTALQNPEQAGSILAPLLGLAQRGQAATTERATNGQQSGW